MTYVRYEHGHLGKSRIICNEMIRIDSQTNVMGMMSRLH